MIRRFLPKTLFGRALLIVVMPTLLVQAVSAYIFYDRHWDNVTRHMANALAGEIAFLAYHATTMRRNEREALAWVFEKTTGIHSDFTPGAKLPNTRQDMKEQDLPEFRNVLAERIDLPFTVQRLPEKGIVEVNIQLGDGVLSFQTSLKRLESSTTTIFMLWMTGSAAVFLLIALLFLRNQVRPIRQLAEAAESFGKGRDIVDLKPHGALEVRRAARAFLIMRERILRQIRSRTEMLAGISHDLRTPLTRMKLQLALLKDAEQADELAADVAQMERMIDEYLGFARGDGGEESASVPLSEILQSIGDDYRRMGHEVPTVMDGDPVIELRVNAFRRMMHNLIDNALRYGQECRITVQQSKGRLELWIDDKGPGIAPEHREEVFRPFTRLDTSRNPKTGGVGLGLAIARDIARGHGGNILLADAPGGGLRVIVRLLV